jgi:hypothetical protein
VVDATAAAQMDDVDAGIAAAGVAAFAVLSAAPAGNIAAPIAPVALINVLRDTSVMIGFPVYVVDIGLFLLGDRTSAT